MARTHRNASARTIKAIEAAGAAALVMGVFGAGAHNASGVVKYSITDLGLVSANAINDIGQVTGGIPGVGHAFLYNSGFGAMQDLGVLEPGGFSVGYGINSLGQVVGEASHSGSNRNHAFRTTPNGVIEPSSDLGTLGGTSSSAHGINDAGQVTGGSDDGDNGRAFRWTPGGVGGPLQNPQMLSLGHFTLGDTSSGTAINASGQVAGVADTISDFDGHPFRYSGGVMTDLGLLGETRAGRSGTASGINDIGQVTGSVWAGGPDHAFLWTAGGSGGPASNSQMKDLFTLGGTHSAASGINNNGQVVGRSNTAGDTDDHAFVYSGAGPMQDLNSLIPSNSGWTLTSAADINNKGQIVGTGTHNGQTRGFLLTPKPKTFGVFIGSNDDFLVASSLPEVAGKTDAQNVRTAFSKITSLNSKFLGYDAPGGADVQAPIFSALDAYTDQVQPGDTFIFFYSGHGGGSFGPTDLSDEFLGITSDPQSGHITDDELAEWFNDPDPVRKAKWDAVNKLIILDSCHAGGFWQSENEPDLSSVPKMALLAACGEFGTTGASASVFDYGEGVFSLALEDALEIEDGFAAADVGHDGLSLNDLCNYLQTYPTFQNGYTGFIKDFSPDPQFIPWDIQAYQSPDFELGIAGGDRFGDFNNDSVVNAADIDLLCDAIDAGAAGGLFDVNSDGAVDNDDLAFYVEQILNTTFGDTDADGDVDLNDLGTLASNFEAGRAAAFAAFEAWVPEPASLSVLFAGAFQMRRRCRR